MKGQRDLPFLESPCGVRQALDDVFRLKIGVGAQDLIRRPTGGQKPHDRRYGYLESPDAYLSAHYVWVESDSRELSMFISYRTWRRLRTVSYVRDQRNLPHSFYRRPNPSRTLRKLANPASRFWMISAATSSGSGRSSRSVRLLSLSQKISRLVLSRAMISS